MHEKFSDVTRLIFPDSTEDDAEGYKDITEYLSKLGSSTMEQIMSEPATLKEESKILTEQTQELAFANYKTFVNTADTSRIIIKDFSHTKQSLDNFLDKMPNFISECENFTNIAKNTVEEKRYYNEIKNQSHKLLGLLELPTLMKEALNSGDYESALDLFSFIRNLSKRYSDIPLIQNTTADIITLWFETLYHLFNQLRLDLPLPQCLQILGYLRRANTVFESTIDESSMGVSFDTDTKLNHNAMTCVGDGLHLHFLKARKAWFDATIKEAQSSETEKHLRKLIELHRIHLFNVLTQHKAIFLSDSQEPKARGEELNGASALSCWLNEKISSLIDILVQGLSKEDEASFESLFNQCMYLGLSFGRVGADLRSVMTPLFRTTVLDNILSNTNKIDSQFENEMKNFKLPIWKSPTKPTTNVQNGPPETLLDFYPLALYCNGLLTILNTVRVTAPLNLAQKIYMAFDASLKSTSQTIIQFYQREQQAFTQSEKQSYVGFCNCFIDDLVPFIQKCLSQVFSPTVVCERLGITLAQLVESKILYIDQNVICEPVSNVISGIKV